MTINRTQINGQQINGGLFETLSGPLVTIGQDVRTLLSGELLRLEQEIELRETLSGALVTLEQNVQGSTSGTLLTLSQRVRLIDGVTLGRGYDANVYLDGYQVPASQLTDNIVISFNEDAGATASLTLLPGSGVQDIGFYYGKTIKIDVSVNDGPYLREFTGVVDTVDFDVIDSKTSLTCTNRRKELLEAISNPQSLFGAPYDISLIEDLTGSNNDIIDKLLPYSDKSLDFDAYNNYYYTSWTPKATPDISLSGANVFRRNPVPEFVNRGRIINRVNLEFTYTHRRLHNAKVRRGINSDQGNWAQSLRDGKTLLSRQTVEATTTGGGWLKSGSVTYVPLPAPGWYGGRAWLGDAQVSKTENTGNTSSGSSLRRSSPIATFNANGAHCLSASWFVYKRWSQDIQKQYTFTVESTTSQAEFNSVVERDASYTVTDRYDDSRWTDTTRFTNSFNTGTGTNINLATSGYTDVTPDEGLSLSNLQAAIAKAQVRILKSHRENTVKFETQLRTGLGLHKTLQVTSNQIQAKGKISSYTHTIQCSEAGDSTTDVTIKFYGLGTGGSGTALAIPAISTASFVSYPTNRTYGARYGTAPNSNPDAVRPGFYGNKYKSGVYTTISPQLIIDYPAIAGGLTDGVQFGTTNTYNTEIPTSTVVITYD